MKRLACALLFLLTGPAVHAQDWPRKPITFIVPNALGGAYDAAARPMAQSLAQTFGQPFVVDNRPAGAGLVGVLAAAKAAPDGHTLLFTGQGQISLYPVLRANLPYEPFRDLAPIIRIGSLESFVMVHSSVPAKSLRELFDLARAKPDSVTWGTWGGTSTSNMYVEYIRKGLNVHFYSVPYKSAAQALNAGIIGEVQVTMFGQGQSLAHVKAGKFRALASTGRSRSAFLPGIPTMKESGVGFDLEPSSWIGMFAPAGTSRDIVRRVNGAVGKLLADRAYTEKALLGFGFQPDAPASPEDFAEFLKQDRKAFAELIRITGVKDE